MGAKKGNNYAAGGKLNQEWINAFDKVVNDDYNAIYLTEEELRILTNEEYGDVNYICENTFTNWKKGELQGDDIIMFLGVYKRALIKQKKILFGNMSTDDKAWTRWAWIIERKFSEWNLKHISENKNENNNNSTLNINMNKDGVDDLKDII